MKIRHYLYNTFLIETGKHKIAIDPGLNGWIFKPGSLIPKPEWEDITHILVTHCDPDHYWYIGKIAAASGAAIICGEELVQKRGDETFMLNSRRRALNMNRQLKTCIL